MSLLGQTLDKPFPPYIRYFEKDGVRWQKHTAYYLGDYEGRPIEIEPGDGLRVCNREKAADGYVLFSPDFSFKYLLIDMQGKIVHEWQVDGSHVGQLLPNGHLLYDTEFSMTKPYGLTEVDWDGNEVWHCPAQVHHDFQRLDNGNTMILSHRQVDNPKICDKTLLSTYLIEVTPEKKVVWEWYSEEHTEELERLAGVKFPLGNHDWTHTNTVCVLPETSASRDPRFRAGNIMISHRNLNLAAVIERETGQIVWTWGPGIMDYQHCTIMLPNGHMLAFDNGPNRMWSAIWEVEPISGEIVWSYKGNPPESFCGMYLSNAQRLWNGNTFACSGWKPDDARLFEVTPEGEIVWEFQNCYSEYCNGKKAVYRAYKYPASMIEPLLAKNK